MSFGVFDQESLLAVAAFDPDHSSEACSLVPEHLFDKHHREIFSQIHNFKQSHREAPGTAHMFDLVETLRERFPDRKKHYQRIYDSMQGTWEEGLNVEFVFTRARKFGRWSRLRNGIGLALEVMQDAHDPEDVKINAAEAHVRDALNTSIEVADFGITTHETDRYMATLDDDDHSGFLIGIPELDQVRCQPARKQLLAIEGKYGSGKTFALMNIGINAAMLSRANVLFIPLEMGESECCQRQMSMMFGFGRREETQRYMSFNKDDKGRLIDMEAVELAIPSMFASRGALRKKMVHLRHRKRIVVKAYPSNALTIDKLRALLEGLRARDGFVPDVICIDYLRLMHIRNPTNLRLELGQLAVELKGLAIEMNISICTAAQLNRGGMDGKATGASVSEDVSLNHTADRVLIYNQTEAEELLNIARLYVDKNRSDRAKFEVAISQLYAAGGYAMDSAFVHTDYLETIEDMNNGSR